MPKKPRRSTTKAPQATHAAQRGARSPSEDEELEMLEVLPEIHTSQLPDAIRGELPTQRDLQQIREETFLDRVTGLADVLENVAKAQMRTNQLSANDHSIASLQAAIDGHLSSAIDIVKKFLRIDRVNISNPAVARRLHRSLIVGNWNHDAAFQDRLNSMVQETEQEEARAARTTAQRKRHHHDSAINSSSSKAPHRRFHAELDMFLPGPKHGNQRAVGTPHWQVLAILRLDFRTHSHESPPTARLH
ncbi:hypothetical protein KSW81_002437 [Nannochloris sp. 'desiccata']|nr:hypothetical protein KSW81_002437 [Chlorella desiccata (nom. nud.)]